jgi:hypothetical protein
MKITQIEVLASAERRLDNLFDAKNGHGSVPNSESIDYFGFTVYMKPSEFLKLAAPNKNLNTDFYDEMLSKHEPIGYPFLQVKSVEDFELKHRWKVLSHEGRTRCLAVQKLFGDNVLLPVHIFPQGMRNRSLTDNNIKWAFIPEKGTAKTAIQFSDERVDRNSSNLNLGRYTVKIKAPRHPAEAAAVWNSELNRPHSPANLKVQNRNDDDVTEVLKDEEDQPMNVYHNPSIAPHGTSLPRRCN